MDRQISKLVATCKTIEVARIGAAAVLLRHAGVAMPYAFATDDMLLDAGASDTLLADPALESGGWLARSALGNRLPTMSATLDAETLDLDEGQAQALLAILRAPLRVAQLAGKTALARMPETGATPPGFLEEDDDGAYGAGTRRAAAELIAAIERHARRDRGGHILLMGRTKADV